MECLRWQTTGCSEIGARGICERSRDARKGVYPDVDIFGSPCVWCGGGPCTSASDSVCEPLEFLLKGEPKYFPIFLSPGNFVIANCKTAVPLPKLNYDCLLWSKDGCGWIQDRDLCLRSRDGNPDNPYTGVKAMGNPCVWCAGGVCTDGNEDKCASFDFLYNGQGMFFDTFHEPKESTFSDCDSTKRSRWARLELYPEPKVVYDVEDIQCGGQSWSGETRCPKGMFCLPQGLNSFCRYLNHPLPPKFITTGKQVWWHDTVENVRHMVPPGIDCSKCSCRSNMTLVLDTLLNQIPIGDEFNCGMMDTTPPQPPPPADTVGRFVTSGRQVWWHSPKDSFKHMVTPGADCARCGCNSRLVLVAEADLDAIPTGDPFDCAAEAPAAAPPAAPQSPAEAPAPVAPVAVPVVPVVPVVVPVTPQAPAAVTPVVAPQAPGAVPGAVTPVVVAKDAGDSPGLVTPAPVQAVGGLAPGGGSNLRPTPGERDPSLQVQRTSTGDGDGGIGIHWPLLALVLVLAAVTLWVCLYAADYRHRMLHRLRRDERKKAADEDDDGASASFLDSDASPPASPTSADSSAASPSARDVSMMSPPPASSAAGSPVAASPLWVSPPVNAGVVRDPRHFVQASPSQQAGRVPRSSVGSVVLSPDDSRRLSLNTSALSAAAPSAVSGNSTSALDQSAMAQSLFDQIDVDHDGEITREEWSRWTEKSSLDFSLADRK